MKKVTVDYSDLLSVLDNLQYFVSNSFIFGEEQAKMDQEVIDRLKSQMEE